MIVISLGWMSSNCAKLSETAFATSSSVISSGIDNTNVPVATYSTSVVTSSAETSKASMTLFDSCATSSEDNSDVTEVETSKYERNFLMMQLDDYVESDDKSCD